MANIIGTNGNDTLMGSDSADTINGKNRQRPFEKWCRK
ncbi:hypothetical protein [Nostoc sp. 'Peltigera malacea cyanobiont' DB3992]|nr:hypothetical protein [Nostoc sp. 'Peltigera malacea cyanobiont' DB3992]